MIFIYDLVFNWSEKRRYEFFEWNDDDEIEYIKKIPVFKIDNFDSLLDNTICVNQDFLDKIYNQAEVYGSRKAEKIEYAGLFCNSELNKAIAIEFNEMGNSIYKSNIYFLDMEDVLDVARHCTEFHLDYQVVYSNNIGNCYLTREEIIKKNFLINEINNAYKDNNIEKLKYIYYEIFGKEEANNNIIRDTLVKSLENEFNSNHEKLYNLIKMPYFL